jgi:hypothetical protein
LITFLSALAEMHIVRNPTHLAPAHTTQSRNSQEKLSTLKMQETYLQSPEAGWLDQYDQNLSLKSSRLPLFQAMCLLKSAESLATLLTYLPVRQDSGVTFRQTIIDGPLVTSGQIVFWHHYKIDTKTFVSYAAIAAGFGNSHALIAASCNPHK